MFNQYGPYMYQAPKTINFQSILNGASKTLNVVNQAIPIIKEVKPIFKNAKAVMKIMKGLSSIETNNNDNIKESNQKNGPNFFI